ncbi:MAG: protease modulator HflC [Acidobacteria bacterium]|nr:protease modulator HflC [Acidobacteriota bacterium]
MKGRHIALIIFALLGLIVLSSSIYTVNEMEQVVITQFGRPVGGAITEPGLHFKIPFIQRANYFEKRLLEWDGEANQIPTKDKKYIWVDTFARWKIVDPLRFLQSVGDEDGAQARLDDIIDAAVRDAVTSHLLIEVVRNSNRPLITEEGELREEVAVKIFEGREKICETILKNASQIMPQYGIKLVDVRIKRINYIEDVRRKVYERMISERKRIAERYRSEGQGKVAEIQGEKEKELKRITSEAYRKAQEIMGKADAEATKIYAQAYNRDPEFYSFLRTLESYRKTLKGKTMIILTTKSDYLKYLKNIKR